MKHKLLVPISTMTATLLAGLLFSPAALAQSEWSLAKDAEGIKVYTRAVGASALREFRGEVSVQATPQQVVNLLKDANTFQKWMPDVLRSELLKSSDTEQYHYLENAAPWPLARRDGVYHFSYSSADDAGGRVTTVRVEALPDYLPPQDGTVRVPRSDGFWKIAAGPTAAGTGTHITWQLHTDPGGAVPSWLVNGAVVDTPFKTLKGLRNYLQPQPAP